MFALRVSIPQKTNHYFHKNHANTKTCKSKQRGLTADGQRCSYERDSFGFGRWRFPSNNNHKEEDIRDRDLLRSQSAYKLQGFR